MKPSKPLTRQPLERKRELKRKGALASNLAQGNRRREIDVAMWKEVHRGW